MRPDRIACFSLRFPPALCIVPYLAWLNGETPTKAASRVGLELRRGLIRIRDADLIKCEDLIRELPDELKGLQIADGNRESPT
jgi:hypothetical protein